MVIMVKIILDKQVGRNYNIAQNYTYYEGDISDEQ